MERAIQIAVIKADMLICAMGKYVPAICLIILIGICVGRRYY